MKQSKASKAQETFFEEKNRSKEDAKTLLKKLKKKEKEKLDSGKFKYIRVNDKQMVLTKIE